MFDIIISPHNNYVKSKNSPRRAPLILPSTFTGRPTIFQSTYATAFALFSHQLRAVEHIAISTTLYDAFLCEIDKTVQTGRCCMRRLLLVSCKERESDVEAQAAVTTWIVDSERLFRRWTEHGGQLECKARHVRP